MNESDLVWVLLSSKIENFKIHVHDKVKTFYEYFDNTKSLNRQPVLDIISGINSGLDQILREISK